MNKKYEITDAELEVMQVLWKNENCTLNKIVEIINQKNEKSKSTIKTLLYRLIEKESVKTIVKDKKENEFIANITEEKYLKKANNQFLDKLYNGNINKLMLNFVEDKKVSKSEIKHLLDILDDEE